MGLHHRHVRADRLGGGGMSKHTPGPWLWDGNRLMPAFPDPAVCSVHSILDAEGGYGFLGSDVKDTLSELDADRTLIGAAPDLLNALRTLLFTADDTPSYDAAIVLARAAIAKAEGR